eukprot:INCI12189.1.p1 GENE.INCI12189.1~~INCI12189.1.p1  ORF type:complete len:255 (-),score=60.01 INCI12189.1:519-1283(-)
MAGLFATNEAEVNGSGTPPFFSIGEQIEARYGGGDVYYPGTIGFVHAEARTCDIAYDDGDGEAGVAFALIRKRGAAACSTSTTGATEQESDSGAASSKFSVGVEVEIRGFKGGWKPGTIAVVRDEGSFDVQLADGAVEKGVPPTLVRLKEEAASTASAGAAVVPNSTQQGATEAGARGGGLAAGETAVVAAGSDEVAEALSLPVSSRQEKELKEELQMLVKARERQLRSQAKNTNTIASLKQKIAELAASFGKG